MKLCKYRFLYVAFWAISSLAHSFELNSPLSIFGQIEKVSDGDTVILSLSKEQLIKLLSHSEIKGYLTLTQFKKTIKQEKMTIRFAEIDAPEYAQPFGKEAQQFLQSMIPVGTTVELKIEAIDKYHRFVAAVYKNGEWINESLVRNGAAWVYPEYRHSMSLDRLEAEAKKQKLGLWQEPFPEHPSRWRQQAWHAKQEKERPQKDALLRHLQALK